MLSSHVCNAEGLIVTQNTTMMIPLTVMEIETTVTSIDELVLKGLQPSAWSMQLVVVLECNTKLTTLRAPELKS